MRARPTPFCRPEGRRENIKLPSPRKHTAQDPSKNLTQLHYFTDKTPVGTVENTPKTS